MECRAYLDVIRFGEDVAEALTTKAQLQADATRMEWRSAINAELEKRCADPSVSRVELSRDLWLIMGKPDGFEIIDETGATRDVRVTPSAAEKAQS
jgi:hypothetical protein